MVLGVQVVAFPPLEVIACVMVTMVASAPWGVVLPDPLLEDHFAGVQQWLYFTGSCRWWDPLC